MIDTPKSSANELERQHQLDEALDESYPASDPVAVGTDRREREKRIERDKAEKTD
jgi:hypothetical protein